MRRVNPDQLIDQLETGLEPLVLAGDLLYDALIYAEPQDTERSLMDCHVCGLDSTVLWSGGEGGGMIRFYTSYAHVSPLHRLIDLDTGNFTVGVHNHRYRIAKIPLNASLVNYRMRKAERPTPGAPILHEYGFQSGISGTMGVTGGEPVLMEHGQPDVLLPGDVVVMEPEDLHTVVTPKRADTAWLVIEGTNVPNFRPLIYSPRPDLALSDEGLYRKATHEDAMSSIRYAIKLMEKS